MKPSPLFLTCWAHRLVALVPTGEPSPQVVVQENVVKYKANETSVDRDGLRELLDQLGELKALDRPVVLGVDGYQVLAVKSDNVDEATPYELEQCCPVDAENMIVRTLGAEGDVVLVAIRDRVDPMVRALEAEGLLIRAVVPTAIVLCQAVQASLESDSARQAVMAPNWAAVDTPSSDVVLFEAGQLSDWKVVENPNLFSTLLGDSHSWWLPTGDTRYRDLQTTHEVREYDVDAIDLLTKAIRPWNQSVLDCPFDFSSDFCKPSNKNPVGAAVRFALACILLLLLSIGLFTMIKGQQLQAAARQVDQRTQAVFAEAIPNSPSTRMYQRALNRELDRAKVIEEWAKEYCGTGQVLDSLRCLLESLREVSVTERFETTQLTISPHEVVFHGRVLNTSVVERIKAACEQHGGLELEDQSFGSSFVLRYRILEKANGGQK